MDQWNLPPVNGAPASNGAWPYILLGRWCFFGDAQVIGVDLDAPTMTPRLYAEGYTCGSRGNRIAFIQHESFGGRYGTNLFLLDPVTGEIEKQDVDPFQQTYLVSDDYIVGFDGVTYFVNGKPLNFEGGPYAGAPVFLGDTTILQRPPTYTSALLNLRDGSIQREVGTNAANAVLYIAPVSGEPWVTFNGPGGAWLSEPSEGTKSLTFQLAKRDGYGEGCGCIFHVDGKPWVACKAYGYGSDGETIISYAALRPVGDRDCVCLSMPADQLRVRVRENRRIDIVGYSDAGGGDLPLTIWRDVNLQTEPRVNPATLFSPAKPRRIDQRIKRWSPDSLFPAIWIGCCGYTMDKRVAVTGLPGNCAWSAPVRDPRPVLEDVALRADVDTLLAGLWQTTSAVEDVDRQIAYAKAQGCGAVVLHCDSIDHEAKLELAAARVLAAGLMPIRLAHLVHDAASFRGQVAWFANKGAWGVTVNSWNFFAKDPAQVAEACYDLTVLLRSWPGAEVVIFWGLDRPDSADVWPDFAAWYCELIAAISTPKARPGLTPPVDPPVVVEPPVVTPTTPDPSHTGRNVAIGAAVAGIALLTAELIRRKATITDDEILAELGRLSDQVITTGETFLRTKGVPQ